MNTSPKTFAAAIAAAAVLGGGGVVAATSLADDDTDAPPASITMNAAPPAAVATGGGGTRAERAAPVTAQTTARPKPLRAIRTALAKHPGATAYDIDRETYGWEVKVAHASDRAYELDLSPNGAKVLNTRQTDVFDDDVAEVGNARVSLVEAIRAADRKAPGTLDSADLERDDDYAGAPLLYSLSFVGNRGEFEVTVDATTGAVSQPVQDD